MSSDPEYSFRLVRTSYKSRDLVYEEPGRRLVIYLEMSGARRFDWVGVDESFEAWDVPAGEPIPPAKREQILGRLADWNRARGLRIGIGPAMSMEAIFAGHERDGWTVVRNPDGSTTVSPPQGETLLARLRKWFRRGKA